MRSRPKQETIIISISGQELLQHPLLPGLQQELSGVSLGEPDSVNGKLDALLSNAAIFGVSLKEAGLADKVEGYLRELLAGPGAVRQTLKKYLD